MGDGVQVSLSCREKTGDIVERKSTETQSKL